MRMNKRCTLIIKSSEELHYDTDLGKMVGGREVTKVVPCNIGPPSAQLQNLFGDKLNEVTKVVRVRNCKEDVEYLVIDGQPFYIVRSPKRTNGMTIFYVSEVQNGSVRN